MPELKNPILLLGLDGDGNPVFDIKFTLPDRAPDSLQPTLRMIAAVEEFYLNSFQNLTDGQAHMMLCARDYALLASEHLSGRRSRRSVLLMARLIALFIIANNSLLKSVEKWSDRRWRNGTEESNITSTAIYSIILDFFWNLDQQLAGRGHDLDNV